jgi:hypothetical protein
MGIYRWPRNPVSAPSRPNDQEARTCAERLIALIDLLLQTRPAVVIAIERSAHTIVTDDVRQQIAARLERFGEDDLRLVEALTEQLDHQRRHRAGSPLRDIEDDEPLA